MNKICAGMAAALYGDYVYYSARDLNGLFRTNIVDGITEYIGRFEKEKNILGLHAKAIRDKDVIWWIPMYGRYVSKYDVTNNHIESYELDCDIKYRNGLEPYCQIINGERCTPLFLDGGRLNKNNIYMVPAGTDTLVVFDITTKKKVTYTLNTNDLILGTSCVIKNEIWMAAYTGQDFVVFDTESESMKRMCMPKEFGPYYGICTDGIDVYCTNEMSELYRFHPKRSMFERIEINSGSNESGQVRAVLYRDNHVVMMPSFGSKIKMYDICAENAKQVDIPFSSEKGTITVVDTDEEELMLESFSAGFFLVLNDNKIRRIDISIKDEDFRRALHDNYRNNVLGSMSPSGVISEDCLDLDNFIFYVTSEETSYEGR